MTKKNINITDEKRSYLPENFNITNWESIEPYYNELLSRNINSYKELQSWFLDRSELVSAVSEDIGWRYIKMTCDTTNEKHSQKYEEYVKEFLPKLIPLDQEIKKKINQSPYKNEICKDEGFEILFSCIQNSINIYRIENVELLMKIELEAQKYGQIVGDLTIQHDGNELTLQQASVFLEDQDRELRETIYNKISDCRLTVKDKLDDLYTSLIKTRHEIAVNAGFKNFRDYAFVGMNRFDYAPSDCYSFHDTVKEIIVPLVNDLIKSNKKSMQLDVLKPWDKSVDQTGKPPLKPFKDEKELLEKTILTFDKVDRFFGDCLRTMKTMGHFDLESRKGKAPGGYNYPLDYTGVPFIFMNTTPTFKDMITLLHEGGHAVHSFLTKNLLISDFKHTPSELAELASMSMELITMDHWNIFFTNEDDLKRAKKQHLTQILTLLPWVATIDKFQHWIYENPSHTLQERRIAWNKTFDEFYDNVTDWSGQEEYKNYLWQKQLHLFEVPFYYIEYGIAQLGALSIWRNYKENPTKGLNGYVSALKLGYTKSIPKTYKTADIKFDFSVGYIKELMDFIRGELD